MSGLGERIDTLTGHIVRINPLQRSFIEESITDIRDANVAIWTPTSASPTRQGWMRSTLRRAMT